VSLPGVEEVIEEFRQSERTIYRFAVEAFTDVDRWRQTPSSDEHGSSENDALCSDVDRMSTFAALFTA